MIRVKTSFTIRVVCFASENQLGVITIQQTRPFFL